MSRRTFIIVVIALTLLLVGGWAYFYTRSTSPNSGASSGTGRGLSSLFPFLSNNNSAQTSGDTTTDQPTTSTDTSPASTDPLVKISDRLVAGATFLPLDTTTPSTTPTTTSSTGSTTTDQTPVAPIIPTIRFIERGTGYVYETTARGADQQKVSGTSIIRTVDALFANKGDTTVIRYIKTDNTTVVTFIAKLFAPTENETIGQLRGDFLQDNNIDATVSPDGKAFAFIFPINTGSIGMTMNIDGTNKKQIFESSLSEWLLDWNNDGIFVTTKAAAGVPGFLYKIVDTKTMRKVLGNIPGLTTKMSPNGKYVLYSTSDGATLTLGLHNLTDGSNDNLGLSTLPEKCVWSPQSVLIYCAVPNTLPKAAYPDSWYQGITHFDDSIWKIDATTGITTQISTGEGNDLDATKLLLDPDGKYLVFVNKTDGSLWSLDLAPENN